MGFGVWSRALGLGAIWLCCCLSAGSVEGGKVLVFPMDGSHWLSMRILVQELSERGHEVLVLLPENNLLLKGSESFRTEVYPVSYTKADLDGAFDNLREGLFSTEPQFSDLFANVNRLVTFTSLQVKGCDSLLDNGPLMGRLRAEGFDMVLTDPFLPCGSVLSHLFSIPVVYFLRGLPCGLDSKANQCPSPPSYIPIPFSGNSNVMNFPQRVKNMLMSIMEKYLCKIMYVHFDELVDSRVQSGMTYRELLGHGAFWLLRSDFTFEWPRPIMPNVAFIGGINCAKSAPLPEDVKEFVEGSGEHGFIVFTMGSMVSSMPTEKAKQFLDAFRQIPQRVLWRYTGDTPKDVPSNVKLMKWLPQNDLLAHPKARVFITHGGTHGIYESICNGVPMLSFPLFGDQGDNVHQMVLRGVAEMLTIHDVTTEKLLVALNKLLHDKSYTEKMVTLSRIHHDRPVPPLELAVFWTEFVMRHQGASHLRVAAHELNWVQYHCLDVLALFLLVLLTVVWLTLKCCMFCARKCCCRTGNVKKKQQ